MVIKQGQAILGVITAHPVEDYRRVGYENLHRYYNPLGFFKEVHIFENYKLESRIRGRLLLMADLCYNVSLKVRHQMIVHHCYDEKGIIEAIRRHHIQILRAYETHDAVLALKIGQSMNLPVVVSVH